VLITIESPAPAVRPARALPDRKLAPGPAARLRAAATCLVGASTLLSPLQDVRTIQVPGPQCPQSPSPACVKVYESPAGNSVCARGAGRVIIVPLGFGACPSNYREVTNDPAFADLAAEKRPVAHLPPRGDADAAAGSAFPGRPAPLPCSVKAALRLPGAPGASGTILRVLGQDLPRRPTFTLAGPFGGR
jgi:hypothetical protein